MLFSENWKTWKALIDFKTCLICRTYNGKIYEIDDIHIFPKPPVHNNCRCEIELLQAMAAGTATNKGIQGADWFLKYRRTLPEYYITKAEAKRLGWKFKGTVDKVAPGKMIFGGIYKNKNGHLPSANGRIWYEADINYQSGRRNLERVVFSNDGLIFVTYDHYYSFIEIV